MDDDDKNKEDSIEPIEEPKEAAASDLDEPGIDSDESLSDLDEDQFKDFEEDASHSFQHATAELLPSFSKAKTKTASAEESKKPRLHRRRARSIQRTVTAEETGEILSESDDEALKHNDRPSDPILAAKWDIDQKINNALQSSKRSGYSRKKRGANDEYDLEALADEEIQKLKKSMQEAALKDAEAITEGNPAIHKLVLLPKVENLLRRVTAYEGILDNNLLETIRLWLEPLPDRSLPSPKIQKVLFQSLEALPIETEHLRESGVGKVVLFYKKASHTDMEIRRIADRLVNEWSRPIVKRSADFRDRPVAKAKYNPDEDEGSSGQVKDKNNLHIHSRMPIQRISTTTYVISPQSNPLAQSSHGVKLQDSDQIKKIRARMRATKFDQKKKQSSLHLS